jgi:hypothetical protein
MTSRKTSQLLTVGEAEQLTHRKKASWRRDILERKIPYVKLGRSVRIPIEVVEEMIQQGWREPVSVGEIQ